LRGHNDKVIQPGSSRLANWVQSRYESILAKALRWRLATLGLAAVLLAFSAVLLNGIGTELVPQLD
jgi:multidrug efflux pump subunit AcrB